MVASDEVRMVPDAPTTTKVLFPYVTPVRLSVVPEVFEVRVVTSVVVRMVPH